MNKYHCVLVAVLAALMSLPIVTLAGCSASRGLSPDETRVLCRTVSRALRAGLLKASDIEAIESSPPDHFACDFQSDPWRQYFLTWRLPGKELRVELEGIYPSRLGIRTVTITTYAPEPPKMQEIPGIPSRRKGTLLPSTPGGQ